MLLFARHEALRISAGIEDLGSIRWELVICLAISWLAVFLCLFKGVHSLGKVSLLSSADWIY